MNLHSVAGPCIGAVNPAVTVPLYKSTGYNTSASGKRYSTYSYQTVSAQIQAVSENALRHLNDMNIGGILRRAYFFGSVASIIRADKEGGDLIVFDGKPWKCVHVFEQWPDWCSVAVQQQTETVQLVLTSSAGTHGTISPLGDSIVAVGCSQTYTITPSTGYVVSDVLVDGESVGDVSSYTFSNVAEQHTIAASFVASV